MKNIDLSGVQEATEYKQVTPGGYVCKITAVEDVPYDENTGKGEYLKIEYDIAEGEFKDYYMELYKSKDFWGGSFIKSYKENALPFFKAFTTSVEASNKGYKWDSDETKLKGKLIGLVLAEKEYNKNDGTVSTKLYVAAPHSIDVIKAGKFKVPPKKFLNGASAIEKHFTELPDDEPLPF